ncbi:unnamed protein product, partial [Rotaria sp. Silwood1]
MESGTEISKEASDMILLDNDFASIIEAIETGRLLSDNLKKVAVYLLPGGSWSQIWPVFFYLWFGVPLALSAFLATVFCMLNDVFMSLAMITEKPERDIMSRPPLIRSKDHLLNWKLLLHAYMFVGNLECFTEFFCFCYYWIDNGVPFYSFIFTFENFGSDLTDKYSRDELTIMTYVAQSVYYCSVCLFQFFNYFATRTRHTSILEHNPIWGKGRNWIVFGATIISASIQLLITKVRWFNDVFHTGPVSVKYVIPALGFGMLWLILDELRKWCIRKYPCGFLGKIACLGAAVAGYAGHRISGLGRITGLDPASPFFENTDPIVRLDPSDAKFVDIIHTDGSPTLLLGFGTLTQVGDVDFYPNGGMNQRSCDKTSAKLIHAILNLGPLDIFGPMDIQ